MITQSNRLKATEALEASRSKVHKLTGLGPITFTVFWKLLKKLFPWIIELLLPFVLGDEKSVGSDGEIITPEPYLSPED